MPVDEVQAKQKAKVSLDFELNRTDIGDNEKNKIATEMMAKEAKRIAETKN